jgi:GTP cyclohydrolase II
MEDAEISSTRAPLDVVEGPIRLPLRLGGQVTEFTLWYYESDGGRWASAHVGDLATDDAVPLRIESACVFGHVFHSAKCDCGYQLQTALENIAAGGRGLVVYGIDQDGRGLGIANHFRIYGMRQREGLDSEEVFARLGVSMDNRRYEPVAAVLDHLGVRNVLLWSNNASREAFLRRAGFGVQTELLEAPLDSHNMSTLMLEKEDLGYAFSFPTHADWLDPLQARVEGAPDRSAAALVADAEALLTQVESDHWDTAVRLEEAALPALAAAQGRTVVAYLTDLPRVDELAVYRRLGVERVVVPFPRIPGWLEDAAARAGVRMQDWGRRNRYTEPRPQWEPADGNGGGDVSVYLRDGAVRCVLPAGASLDDLRAAYARVQGVAGAPRLVGEGRGGAAWVQVQPGNVAPGAGSGVRAVTLPGVGTVLVAGAGR